MVNGPRKTNSKSVKLGRLVGHFSPSADGWFKIGVDVRNSTDITWSESMPYGQVAVLEIYGHKFFAVTDFYAGYFPTNQVFTVSTIPMASK